MRKSEGAPRVMLLIPTASYRATDFMEAAAKLDIEVVVGSDERGPLEDAHNLLNEVGLRGFWSYYRRVMGGDATNGRHA